MVAVQIYDDKDTFFAKRGGEPDGDEVAFGNDWMDDVSQVFIGGGIVKDCSVSCVEETGDVYACRPDGMIVLLGSVSSLDAYLCSRNLLDSHLQLTGGKHLSWVREKLQEDTTHIPLSGGFHNRAAKAAAALVDSEDKAEDSDIDAENAQKDFRQKVGKITASWQSFRSGAKTIAILPLLVGGIGIVIGFAHDVVEKDFLFLSLFVLFFYGWIISSGIGTVDELAETAKRIFADVNPMVEVIRRSEKEKTARAVKEMRAKERAGRKDVAKVEMRHQEQLAENEERVEQWRADTRQQIKKLKSEKEALNVALLGAQETLAYYSGQNRIEAYVGESALRECGGIYVVKNVGDDKVKIGITDDNFKRRFAEIQSHCASAGIKKGDVLPAILVPLDEGKYKVEQAIHHALADRKTAGEWFNVSPEEAIAIVLEHVHNRRVANSKMREKMPPGNKAAGNDRA